VLGVMAHLSRWLAARSLDAQELDSKRIDEFLKHRRAVGYTCWLSRRGLEPILKHLQFAGAVPMPGPIPEPKGLGALVKEYEGYLTRERAVTASTTSGYLRVAQKFLASALDSKTLDVHRLTPADVSFFILRESRSCSVGYAKLKVTALRSLLRYLHVRGVVTKELGAVVPAVAGWRLVGTPKSLTPGEVKKLLGSCDRRTLVGRRDFAVILFMVRLGLRSCEVASLSLDDIDWQAGEFIIHGKGYREDRMPLPQDVGAALVSYLERGRRRSSLRPIFLQARAPHGRLSPAAVKGIVRGAGRRIGIDRLGAHLLRHTAATQMLRKGASLPHIAQVLRHRHLDTTAIYTKVDRRRLRALARRWPGGK
jgi:site-specific recombinase XerD